MYPGHSWFQSGVQTLCLGIISVLTCLEGFSIGLSRLSVSHALVLGYEASFFGLNGLAHKSETLCRQGT